MRIKRVVPQRSGPPLFTYGVAVAGTESFGFAAGRSSAAARRSPGS